MSKQPRQGNLTYGTRKSTTVRTAEEAYAWVEEHPHHKAELDDRNPNRKMFVLTGHDGFACRIPVGIGTDFRTGGPFDRRMYRAPLPPDAAVFARHVDDEAALAEALDDAVTLGKLAVVDVVRIVKALYS